MINIKPILTKYKLHIVTALISAILTFILSFNLGVVASYHRILDWVLGGNVTSVGQIFSEQFNDSYKVVFERIGDTNIFIASSNISAFNESEDIYRYDEKASPLIITQNAGTKEINAIYEISFKREKNPDYNSGNIIFPKTIEFKDINGDSKKELVTVWEISWGGSGGVMGMAIFEENDGFFIPVTSYPKKISLQGYEMILTEEVLKNQIAVSAIGSNVYTNLTDLNNDKKPEFLYGDFEWQAGEGHLGEHLWNLQVFELKNNKYQIADWWNKGKTFKTSKKYSFFSRGEFPSIEELIFEFSFKY